MLPKKPNGQNGSFKEKRLLNFADEFEWAWGGSESDEATAESAESLDADREKAAANLKNKTGQTGFAKNIERLVGKKFYKDNEQGTLEQATTELEKESLEDASFDPPEKFTDKFDNEDEFRFAINQGQVNNWPTMASTLMELGINQTKFVDELYGFFSDGVSAETLFEMSRLGEKYDDIEEAEEKLVELANQKDLQKNMAEIKEITTVLTNIRALGNQIETLAYTPPANEHPDTVTEITVADETLAKQFGNPEVLAAMMGYYYGIDNAVKKGYIKFELDRNTDKYKLVIKDIPKKDQAMFKDAASRIDTIKYIGGSYSITEGIRELYDHPNVLQALTKNKLENLDTDLEEHQFVQEVVAALFNPIKEGPITDDGRMLGAPELVDEGEYAQKEDYLNQRRSEKAAYEITTKQARDYETGKYSLPKLADYLNTLLAQGKMQILLDAAAREKYQGLEKKDFPKITAETLREGKLTEEMRTLIRYGFVLDRKEATNISSRIEDLENALGRPTVQEIGRVITDFVVSNDGLERIGAGATLFIPLTEDKKVDLELGVNTDITKLKNSFAVVAVHFESEEGHEASVGTGLNPGTVNIGVSGKINLDDIYFRVSGGVGSIGPLLAAGASIGVGKDLESYITAHKEETIEKFYNGSQETLALFKQALKEDADVTKLAGIARELQTSDGQKPLKAIYEAQLNRLPAPVTPEMRKMLDQTTIELFKEFSETLNVAGLEKTDEFGWEINGGVAAVEGFGVIPFAAVTFEFPTGTIVRYSIPEGVPSNITARAEAQIQSQLEKQAGSLGNLKSVTRTESDEIFYSLENNSWVSNRTQEIPELQILNMDPEAKAKQLTEIYSKYGMQFEPLPAERNLPGYVAMNFPFVEDSNFSLHVDPTIEGIHIIPEEGPNGPRFLVNFSGVKNLVITQTETIHPAGKPDVMVTISDTAASLQEITAQEPSYYHYQNGYMSLKPGKFATDKLEHPALGGPRPNIESPYLSNLDESYFEASAGINEALTGKYPGSIPNREQLDKLVRKLDKKAFLKRFSATNTLLRRNRFQQIDHTRAVKLLKDAYKKEFGKELTSPRELQYLFEKITEETFTKLDRNGSGPRGRRATLKEGTRIANGFLKSALNRHPQLSDNFTAPQKEAIRKRLIKDFNEKIKTLELKDPKQMFISLDKAGLEHHYLLSTAAAKEMGKENWGFRPTDTNEASTIEVLAGSLSSYNVDVNNPNSEESLVARFLLEMSDPLPETNDIANAELLLRSPLAHMITTLPLPQVNGKPLNFLALAMGPDDATMIRKLIKNPDQAVRFFTEPQYQDAYKEFYVLLKKIRKEQLLGKPFNYNFNNITVKMSFPTETNSMFLQRCGNSTFSVHQKILVETFTPKQGLIGASTSVDYGYEAKTEMESVKVTLGAAYRPEKDDIPPEDVPEKEEGAPEPEPEIPDEPEPAKAPGADEADKPE